MSLEGLARRRLLRAGTVAALGSLVHSMAAAAALAPELRVVTGEQGAATKEICDAILARFPAARIDDDARRLADRAGPGIFVTLGPAALQAALDAGAPGPVLALFISNAAYARLIAIAPKELHRGPVTGIFAEADPVHQLRVARALYKRHIAVAVFLSAGTAHLRPQIEDAARLNGVDLELSTLEPGVSVVRALGGVRDARALLMVPDGELYTSGSIRDLLEATYRRGLGVIGFSAALVRAGTLAAAYSTVEDVLAQAVTVHAELVQGHAPAARYPLYWRTLVNDRVARSLDVVVTESDRAIGNPARTP